MFIKEGSVYDCQSRLCSLFKPQAKPADNNFPLILLYPSSPTPTLVRCYSKRVHTALPDRTETLTMMDYAACDYYRPVVMMELSSTPTDSALIACIMKLSEKTEGEEGKGGA